MRKTETKVPILPTMKTRGESLQAMCFLTKEELEVNNYLMDRVMSDTFIKQEGKE